jgi:phosphomannomutase
VEKCGWFPEIRRTRIGSPFVVASMMEASAGGAKRVVGYEANGGFLLNSDIQIGDRKLRALPTRDAVIVMLGILLLAKSQRLKISELAASLPARFTASDRLKSFATEKSAAMLAKFNSGSEAADKIEIEKMFGGICGRVAGLNRTDGLRIIFANDEIIHLRPSGNAPEFRCYAEAKSDERARAITTDALARINS